LIRGSRRDAGCNIHTRLPHLPERFSLISNDIDVGLCSAFCALREIASKVVGLFRMTLVCAVIHVVPPCAEFPSSFALGAPVF
jgi:hypothetical protein